MIAVDGTEHAQRIIMTVEAIAMIYCREQETLHSVFTLMKGHVHTFKYCSQTGFALLHLQSVQWRFLAQKETKEKANLNVQQRLVEKLYIA